MKDLTQGINLCLTVTQVHGIVLAKSAFHHSMNYESVVIFGKGELVTDPAEKDRGLKCISDHIIAGRWEESRLPSAKELKGTSLVRVEIEEASAKIRTGGPSDDPADEELPIWAGLVNIHRSYSAEAAVEGDPPPPSVTAYLARN
jgi:hypothetical protein